MQKLEKIIKIAFIAEIPGDPSNISEIIKALIKDKRELTEVENCVDFTISHRTIKIYNDEISTNEIFYAFQICKPYSDEIKATRIYKKLPLICDDNIFKWKTSYRGSECTVVRSMYEYDCHYSYDGDYCNVKVYPTKEIYKHLRRGLVNGFFVDNATNEEIYKGILNFEEKTLAKMFLNYNKQIIVDKNEKLLNADYQGFSFTNEAKECGAND